MPGRTVKVSIITNLRFADDIDAAEEEQELEALHKTCTTYVQMQRRPN